MKQLSTNTTFSALKGLKKSSKKKSNPSSLSKLLGLINKTVYQVQDDSYGMGFREWKGGIIKINGKIFPNGKGCFYGEDGEEIQKKILSFQIGNNFYTGEWKKGKQQHGQGKYIWPNVYSYTGGWENGKPHGQGTITFANGDIIYDGGWKNGKKHGKGTLICKSGVFYEGTFENDFATDFSKIIITDSNNKPHTITKKVQSYFYQKEGKVEEEQEEGKGIEIDIENEKRLKSVLLQFGNIQSNQEDTKTMENLEELQKFIKENKIASKDNKAKFYVIQVNGNTRHAFIIIFEKGEVSCFDNGGLNNGSLKDWRDVIEKNHVKYEILPHEPNLKFHLKDGKPINIPIKTNTHQFCCRHGTNVLHDILTYLNNGPEGNESLVGKFFKYLQKVSEENNKSLPNVLGTGKPRGFIRINSSRNLSPQDTCQRI